VAGLHVFLNFFQRFKSNTTIRAQMTPCTVRRWNTKLLAHGFRLVTSISCFLSSARRRFDIFCRFHPVYLHRLHTSGPSNPFQNGLFHQVIRPSFVFVTLHIAHLLKRFPPFHKYPQGFFPLLSLFLPSYDLPSFTQSFPFFERHCYYGAARKARRQSSITLQVMHLGL
jgi:hypothetical protein